MICLINIIKITYQTLKLMNYESEKKIWMGVKLFNITPAYEPSPNSLQLNLLFLYKEK